MIEAGDQMFCRCSDFAVLAAVGMMRVRAVVVASYPQRVMHILLMNIELLHHAMVL